MDPYRCFLYLVPAQAICLIPPAILPSWSPVPKSQTSGGPTSVTVPHEAPPGKQYHWLPNESPVLCSAWLCSTCCSVSIPKTVLVPPALPSACSSGPPSSTKHWLWGLLHFAQQACLIPSQVCLMSSFDLAFLPLLTEYKQVLTLCVLRYDNDHPWYNPQLESPRLCLFYSVL